jgi:hypothetical protein
MARHDPWKRRRAGLPPLTNHETNTLTKEKKAKEGKKRIAAYIYSTLLDRVTAYAETQEITKESAWNQIIAAGLNALEVHENS